MCIRDRSDSGRKENTALQQFASTMLLNETPSTSMVIFLSILMNFLTIKKMKQLMNVIQMFCQAVWNKEQNTDFWKNMTGYISRMENQVVKYARRWAF